MHQRKVRSQLETPPSTQGIFCRRKRMFVPSTCRRVEEPRRSRPVEDGDAGEPRARAAMESDPGSGERVATDQLPLRRQA